MFENLLKATRWEPKDRPQEPLTSTHVGSAPAADRWRPGTDGRVCRSEWKFSRAFTQAHSGLFVQFSSADFLPER